MSRFFMVHCVHSQYRAVLSVYIFKGALNSCDIYKPCKLRTYETFTHYVCLRQYPSHCIQKHCKNGYLCLVPPSKFIDSISPRRDSVFPENICEI